MSTALPSPYLFACFPLQEYFVNKDTGLPLSGGWVQFYSDEAFTVPKDVYQYSYAAGQWTEVNIGSTLVLSIAGTFQHNNVDIIPYLFPYQGTPQSPGDLELYFIRVWSRDPNQGGVLQFTRSGWPPNLTDTGNVVDNYDNSNNGISNPEFSIVNFTPDPATGVYTLTAPFTDAEIAPGWKLTAGGTGNVKLKQILLTQEWESNPSYAIEIDTAITATNVRLVQRLNQSPRVYYGTYVSMAILAASLTSTAKPVNVNYIPSTGTAHNIASGTTPANNNFDLIVGVNLAPVFIDGTSNTSAPNTGYVDISIDVPTGAIMQYTSCCLVTVANGASLIPYVQSTNAEQTNAMFWYYKPELEYKPIPSYALGWDFAMNPFQAEGYGPTGPYNITGPGKSFYVADQTILFQNTTNTVTVSKENNRTIKLAVSANPTSMAVIQYLGASEAQELLNNPVCSQIRAKISTGTVVGRISLYFTKNANLPTLGTNQAANCYTLVSAVNTTTAEPTVGGGGNYGDWIPVKRSNLGTAYFTLTPTMTTYGFNGWLSESAQADINQATYFAIVVTFASVPVGSNIEIEHISLQKGYIPTPPAALSFGETLAGLQQYYEKSYDVNVLPKAITTTGTYAYVAYLVGAPEFGLTVTYKVSKRAAPTFTASPTTYSNLGILSPQTGTYSVVYEQGITDRPVSVVISSQNNFWFTYDATSVSANKTIEFQFVADARFGIQN